MIHVTPLQESMIVLREMALGKTVIGERNDLMTQAKVCLGASRRKLWCISFQARRTQRHVHTGRDGSSRETRRRSRSRSPRRHRDDSDRRDSKRCFLQQMAPMNQAKIHYGRNFGSMKGEEYINKRIVPWSKCFFCLFPLPLGLQLDTWSRG